jgi:hypothetical protein
VPAARTLQPLNLSPLPPPLLRTPPARLPLDVQGGELPVLPLSIPGAVSMTHAPDSDVLLSGDEFFIFKARTSRHGRAAPRRARLAAAPAFAGARPLFVSALHPSAPLARARRRPLQSPTPPPPHTPRAPPPPPPPPPQFTKNQAGLAGLSFDEGRFGVFAYVTEGMADIVPRLQTGDVLVRAEITQGADKLVRPAAAAGGGGGEGALVAAAQ